MIPFLPSLSFPMLSHISFRSTIAVPNAWVCVLCLCTHRLGGSEAQGVLCRAMMMKAAGMWTEEHLLWLTCHMAESNAKLHHGFAGTGFKSQLQCHSSLFSFSTSCYWMLLGFCFVQYFGLTGFVFFLGWGEG